MGKGSRETRNGRISGKRLEDGWRLLSRLEDGPEVLVHSAERLPRARRIAVLVGRLLVSESDCARLVMGIREE